MWYYLFRHSEHEADQTGVDGPIASEIPVLHSLYQRSMAGQKVMMVEASTRPDVRLMAAHFLAGIPKDMFGGIDLGGHEVFGIFLEDALRSRISADPELKKKLKAEYTDSEEKKKGLTVEEYVLLEKVGLWPQITQWAEEIMTHLFELENEFGQEAVIVGFSHGGILEPVYCLASHLRNGGELERWCFLGLANSSLNKGFDRCAGLGIEITKGQVTTVRDIPRPEIKVETIVK